MGGGKDKHDEQDKGLFGHSHGGHGYPPGQYPPQPGAYPPAGYPHQQAILVHLLRTNPVITVWEQCSQRLMALGIWLMAAHTVVVVTLSAMVERSMGTEVGSMESSSMINTENSNMGSISMECLVASLRRGSDDGATLLISRSWANYSLLLPFFVSLTRINVNSVIWRFSIMPW